MVIVAAIATPFIAKSLNTNNTGFKTTTSYREIDVHGTCKAVKSNGGTQYFVPTKGSSEWTAFRNNKPSDVTLGLCCESLVISGSSASTDNFRRTNSSPRPTPSAFTYGGAGAYAHFYYPDVATANKLCAEYNSAYTTGGWASTYTPTATGWAPYSDITVRRWDGSSNVSECVGGQNCYDDGIPSIRTLHCCGAIPATHNPAPPVAHTPVGGGGGGSSCDAGCTYSCTRGDCWCSCPTDGSCFVAGTKVKMADNSLKNIEDVKIGDKVIGKDDQINTVLHLDRPKLSGRKLYAINGSEAFVTEDHPFLTTEGWKSRDPESSFTYYEEIEVTLLEVGDHIVREDGTLELIESLRFEKADPNKTVYAFDVDGNDSFIADGYVVHNSGAHQE